MSDMLSFMIYLKKVDLKILFKLSSSLLKLSQYCSLILLFQCTISQICELSMVNAHYSCKVKTSNKVFTTNSSGYCKDSIPLQTRQPLKCHQAFGLIIPAITFIALEIQITEKSIYQISQQIFFVGTCLFQFTAISLIKAINNGIHFYHFNLML